MTQLRHDLNDEQFEQLLEGISRCLFVPSMGDAVEPALHEIRYEQGSQRKLSGHQSEWGEGWSAQAQRSLDIAPNVDERRKGTHWRELALFIGGLVAAATVVMVLVLVFRGFDESGQTGLGSSSAPAVPVDPALESSVLLRSEDSAAGFRIRPVDSVTGNSVTGYQPLRVGVASFVSIEAVSGVAPVLAAIESQGIVTESTSEGARTLGSADVLHVVDLTNWSDQTVDLPGKSWASSITFSPDGRRIALVLNSEQESSVLEFEVQTAALLAERTLEFRPSVLSYVAGGSQLVVYGQRLAVNPGIDEPDPPQLALFEAATLQPVWTQSFPDVASGVWCFQDCSAPHSPESNSRFEYWVPAVVASPKSDKLYILHADSDRLTTVDLASHSVGTRLIEEPQAFLDRLVGLFVNQASAKGETSGAQKSAVLSADGSKLYMLEDGIAGSGENRTEVHRLQIIDVSSAIRIASRDLTAGQTIVLTPDGNHLIVSWQDENPTHPGWMQTWNEVRDAETLDVSVRFDDWQVTTSRTVDGQPIILAARQNRGSYTTDLAVINPGTLELASHWTVDGIASWVDSDNP
jgi:hypothetical protein